MITIITIENLTTDAVLIGLVISITNNLKRRFPNIKERWVPLLPWIPAFVIALASSLYIHAEWPGLRVFGTEVFLQTLKFGFASMGSFKLYKTTIKGE